MQCDAVANSLEPFVISLQLRLELNCLLLQILSRVPEKQIKLNARGEQWSQRLRDRRDRLADWCDTTLIQGRFEIGSDDFTEKVDPATCSVVYWEHYPEVR